MDIKLFPRYLPWLQEPEFAFTSKVGLSGWTEQDVKEGLIRQKDRYNLLSRTTEFTSKDVPGSLKDLFGEYDLSKLNMMWTFFWDEPKKVEQGWGFADMSEVNIVVVPSGRIEAYNAHPIRDMPGSTDCLGVLAKNLESYLEALFFAQFNKIHFIRGFPDEDPVLSKKTLLIAKLCALIAGGDEYYPFWSGLLGVSSSETSPNNLSGI